MDAKKIITPVDKIEVELKSFITGREKRKIKGVFLKSMRVGIGAEGAKASTEEVDMEKITNEAEDIALSTVVISVGGVKEKILDALLNLKSKDFDFVVKEVNSVTNDDDFLAPLKTPKVITEREN